jgi:hypothetical protein
VELYKQDNALFGFFVCAVSAIDLFFYATYWLGVILKSDEFPSDTKSLKRLYPGPIAKYFLANFQGEALTTEMEECINDPKYIALKDMRDVLSHRGLLRRTINIGGKRDGIVTMVENPKDSLDSWQDGLTLNEETTVSRHLWLSGEITKLVAATDEFCGRKLSRPLFDL